MIFTCIIRKTVRQNSQNRRTVNSVSMILAIKAIKEGCVAVVFYISINTANIMKDPIDHLGDSHILGTGHTRYYCG